MKKLVPPFLLVALVSFSACASSFSERRAKEVTPQFLVSIYSVDTIDQHRLFRSDTTYHYFLAQSAFRRWAIQSTKKKMYFLGEFPISSGREPVVMLGHFDEASRFMD